MDAYVRSSAAFAGLTAAGRRGAWEGFKSLWGWGLDKPASENAMHGEDAKIIFLHIPKTAGTSLRQIVKKEYPRGQCLFIYSHTPAYLAAARRKLPRARAVYGHISYGIHEILGVEARYVTFLRHPVRRVLSFYNHQARKRDAEFHRQVKAGMSLVEMLESGICHQVNNHMVRIISGYQGTAPVYDTAVLEKAAANMAQHFLFVGVVEHLATSVKRLGRRLEFRKRHRIPRRNVNLNPLSRLIDERTRAAIEHHNRLDLMLYEQVERSFREAADQNP